MAGLKNEIYTIEVLKQGFERFRLENGHYPTSDETDQCPYLCSSRQIQRKFGGMNRLRKLLEITDSDYAFGEHRRKLYENINKLAIISERQVAEYLKTRYGEICVHEEKKYGLGRNRVDFFVYAKTNFAVEVFNTYTLRNLMVNLNMKLHKYSDFSEKIFFVVTGADLEQTDIDRLIERKTTMHLMNNMSCVTFHKFQEECNCIVPLKLEVKQQINLF